MFRVWYQAVLRILLVSLGLLVCGAVAQDQPDQKSTDKPAQDTAGAPAQAQPADAVDPLKRPANEKQRKKNQRALKQELSKPYKKWLDEDVVYIITDEERAAFRQLSNDEERDNFIEAFWQRRDPTPDTEENEYKEEHYQRIAYANEHFAAGVPGWRTDRGRIYIVFGKPHRPGSDRRIRGYLPVRRVSHDDGSFRERRAPDDSERRPDYVGTDGHGEQVAAFLG